MPKRHREDALRYQQLLEQTRDEDGVEHRDLAVKTLTAELLQKADRAAEFAEARANQVADGFDNSHGPETEDGQMRLDFGTYLALGDTGRVRVDQAMAKHTRLWLDVQNKNFARQSIAHGAKTLNGYQLLDIQEEHNCTMWAAELIRRGPEQPQAPEG